MTSFNTSVRDNLPWNGMSVKGRIDALQKAANTLINEHGNLTQEEYNSKASNFYSKLRASWERALEEIGLSNVVRRHRDYINVKGINKISALNPAACQECYKCWSHCCDNINAHDPSIARNQAAPEPDQLLEEANKLSEWVKDMQGRKKAIPDNS